VTSIPNRFGGSSSSEVIDCVWPKRQRRIPRCSKRPEDWKPHTGRPILSSTRVPAALWRPDPLNSWGSAG
jgi:hypothetical protein